MKKLIKLEFNNTTRERKTEDSYSELYSYDKNNGSFEFEILNDTLTTEQVTALFKFTESNKIWKTTGTVEGNKVNVTFDTSLITQNETVICYLYFDEEQRTSDTFRFKFKVKVSEIDKMSRYEVKERFINNTVIVDRLDVVTKEELKKALKNVGGIATEGLLTEVKAEELFVKKNDAVDNTNFELVKNRVLALELKTDKDTVYDDSEVKERLTTLENKQPVDLSNYATKEELRTVSGSQPNVDNLVTKEELEAKHYISDVSNLATKEELQEVRNSQPTVDTSNLVTRDELEAKGYVKDLSEYAKKSELYNDSDLKARVEVLEQKTDKDTVYDDTPLKERVTALESKAIEGGAYDDKPIRDRLDVLEAKHDNDTIYDDTEVKRRLTEIESKPAIDTSVFVTEEKLNGKGYITDISGLATKQELANAVTKDELEAKHYVTEEQLNNKAYLTQQNLDNYALKSELPTPYNDTPLNERVTALESKAIEGGTYDDTDLRNRVINLENKSSLDTSEFVTNQALESRGYIKDVSNLVTKDELEGKHYISDISNLVTKEELENKGYLKTHQNLDNVVTKEELATKGYITDVSNLVTKEELESKNYLTTPYNDTPLIERVEVLENKVDKDTVYNDTELRNRVEVLEHKPNVDLSNYVTNEQLENKGFIKQHQELSHLATTSDLEALRNIAVSKAELSKKLDTTEFNTLKDIVVTKDELAGKGYLTEHQDISNLATKQEVEETYAKKTDLPTPYNDSALVQKIGQLEARVDKDTVYDDTNIKERLTNLENKPTVDTTNFVTNEALEEKHYVTNEQISSTYAIKSEIPQPYNDSALVNRINVLEAKTDNDTVYNDEPIKQRLTALENRPTSQSEIRGTGMPNGVVEAPIGTTYIDTAKTNGALKWIKTTDGGNTGWKVVEGDTGWVLGWQADMGNNKNRMYFRRKNDVVHVKFNPEIKTSKFNNNSNLILEIGGYWSEDTLSINGFKPVDDIVQTIYGTSSDIYSNTSSAENSEGSQGTGAVIIQYEYNLHNKSGLKLQIVTSELGVEENHVNPFSYLTEDEWPVQLP